MVTHDLLPEPYTPFYCGESTEPNDDMYDCCCLDKTTLKTSKILGSSFYVIFIIYFRQLSSSPSTVAGILLKIDHRGSTEREAKRIGIGWR